MWQEVDQPGKELDAAVVQNAFRKQLNDSKPLEVGNASAISDTISGQPKRPPTSPKAAGGRNVVNNNNNKTESISKADKKHFDMEVVNKLIGNMTTSEKYSISFHDFGGQDVFASIFNYFMNPDTLYLIVTSMEELLSPDTAIVEVNLYRLIH